MRTVLLRSLSIHARPVRPGRQQGFALLIALALMSFMLVSVIAFTAVVRVESRVAGMTQKEVIAREHARLGLLVALGKLQRHAGPDRAATATSDVLTNVIDASNHHVTGVWDTTFGANAEPTWLVSYPEDEPDDFDVSVAYPPDLTVDVLGEGTLGLDADGADLKRVHRVSVPDATDLSMGHYGFWVSDEGVKASLAKVNRQPRLEANGAIDPEERERMLQLTPGRPRNEQLFETIDETAAEDAWVSLEEDLLRTRRFEQLSLIPELEVTALQTGFHDMTWVHRGVLSNPADGGLKLDLSSNTAEDPNGPFPLNEEFQSFLNQRTNNDDYAPVRGVQDDLLEDGAPINTVPLILTEVGLYCGFFRDAARSNTLKMAMRLRADVWNPFSFPLGFNPRNQDDFIIEFDDMPPFTVEWETGRGTTGSQRGQFNVDVEDLNWRDIETNRNFSWNDFRFDIFWKMNVGEVRNIRQKVQANIPNVAISDPNPSRVTDDFFRITAPAADVTIRVRTLDGRLIQEYRNVPFGGLDTSPFPSINIRSRSDPSYGDFQFVYHFRFYDELGRLASGASDTERWLSEFDPRSMTFEMNAGGAQEEMFDVSDDPGFAAIDGTLFLGRPEFFYGGGRFGSGQGGSNYHRFFDFPSTEPVSVGWLQHLYLHNRAPFSIGNPWGGELNRAFDRYYFSTVPDVPGIWEPFQFVDSNNPTLGYEPLVNVHLSTYQGPFSEPLTLDAAQRPTSAQYFLIEGAFNVNSTSVDAWMTMLAGLNLYEWEFRRNESGREAIPRERVKNGLFRFPMGADRHYEHPSYTRGRDDAGGHTRSYPEYPEVSQQEHREWFKNKWQPDWAAAFTVGMRELREGNNPDEINDVEELAEAIVTAIEEREEPFLTMEDFVNSGVLQEAIDNTRINTVTADTYSDIGYSPFDQFPRYAPSFLTQADILSTLGPLAQTRSDTFTIRAYGDHVNPVTGEIEGRAWVEARVQRLPDPVEYSDPSNPAQVERDTLNPPGNFGRRFVITDFRWLDEEDV